jgi:t-SNARE complex subunit (syntaxin)
MAKLIFETDNGEYHEINISTISTKSLKQDDVILVDCEIGDSLSHKATEQMIRVRDMLQSYFKENSIIVTAMRNGKKDINIKIIHDNNKKK